jgi:hypothetical protein
MTSDVLEKVREVLTEAGTKKSWGSLQVDVKNGEPYLLRWTVQEKLEENSPNAYRKY